MAQYTVKLNAAANVVGCYIAFAVVGSIVAFYEEDCYHWREGWLLKIFAIYKLGNKQSLYSIIYVYNITC